VQAVSERQAEAVRVDSAACVFGASRDRLAVDRSFECESCQTDDMSSVYRIASTPAEVRAHIVDLGALTAIVDVEPLVTAWDTDQAALDDGLVAVLGLLAGSGLETVVFTTNSSRAPSRPPSAPAMRVGYIVSAAKPLRLAAYRDLPEPGVVIGDQVATDGLLARRLGFTFVHYAPNVRAIPLGPRFMRQLGRPIRAAVLRSAEPGPPIR
jgi:predicted HAD superfamily phosphohydrolase YqeG